MIDVYESTDAEENPNEGDTHETNSQSNHRTFVNNTVDHVTHEGSSSPQQKTPPTTTISTIALQSGDTRLVIALLQVRQFIHACINIRLLFSLSIFSTSTYII